MTADPTAVRASACGPNAHGEQLGDPQCDGGGGDAAQRPAAAGRFGHEATLPGHRPRKAYSMVTSDKFHGGAITV